MPAALCDAPTDSDREVELSQWMLESVQEMHGGAPMLIKLGSRTTLASSSFEEFPGYRICTNLVQQAFWIYGMEGAEKYQGLTRSATWSKGTTPEKAWEEVQRRLRD